MDNQPLCKKGTNGEISLNRFPTVDSGIPEDALWRNSGCHAAMEALQKKMDFEGAVFVPLQGT